MMLVYKLTPGAVSMQQQNVSYMSKSVSQGAVECNMQLLGTAKNRV